MNIEECIAAANVKRSEWAAGDAKRDAGLTVPENIEAVYDINYYSDHDTNDYHLMDIYYPKDVNLDKYPVIVSVHGGGWFYGDKKLYSFYCMHLATFGYAVVNFNYRLSPEHKYPSGFMDVCHLMDYINIYSNKFKLDINELYMVGDSAGAQLCSQYCIWATSDEYHHLLDPAMNITAPVPKKVALNCGVYDMKAQSGRDELCNWYLPEGLNESSDLGKSYYNILDYINASFPSAYIMTSYNDALKDCSAILIQKLQSLGVDIVVKEYAKDSPDDGHVFHLNMYSELGKQCNIDEINFFQKV